MMRTISRKSKIREGRGTGRLSEYKPWIKAREVSSIGTTHNIVDWKHGRTVELLSEGEAWLYYILRWDDSVEDIREQYPLNLEETNDIADTASIMRVNKGEDNMTTDMLVTMSDGSLRAYSVKASHVDMKSIRNIEKLWIEKMYWNKHGVTWKQIYKEDLDRDYVDNIRLCVEYYDGSFVQDDISMIKHLIATKKICVDMESGMLDFEALVQKYKKENGWKI